MPIIKYLKYNKSDNGENNADPFVIQEGKMKLGKMKTSHRFDWTEEALALRGGEKETVGKNFNFSNLSKISAVLAFFLLIIFTRAAWLQIVKGEYYYKLAEGNRIRIERVEAKRGIIYDSESRPLVRNIANFLLYFMPVDFPDNENERDGIIKRVSEILGDISADEIKLILAKVKQGSLESYQPLFIADNIEYEKAMLLYLESVNMPGVVLSNKTRREYDLCENSEDSGSRTLGISALSHILGYTGKIDESELAEFGSEYSPIDYIGKMGIEYFWENELKGRDGRKQIEVDALGKEKKIINQEPTEDGRNLILSLDFELQRKLEETLSAALQKLKLKKGAAIIMDPNNGEILAMVSLPAYNNNIFARGATDEEYQELAGNPDNPLFNRCVSGEYPSGSTIKPVIAAAALEEGVINEHTSFNSAGGIRIGEWFFPDWRAGGHGVTDVRRALAESINTFFYYIGGGYQDFKGLGMERIVQYGKLFGLSSQLGIDLPGEADGFLPSKEWKEEAKGERWYIGDTYHLSIGQGDLLVTPLQVAGFTGVFANGGKLYRPHLVKQILTDEDKLLRDIEPEVIRADFISDYNIEVVRQGMRQTVISGSAGSLRSVPVAVAGKTGTAQWSSKKQPHAWFTGFAPYDNPELVITVLIEEGGEGSSAAVPVANEILSWYFQNKK